MSEILRTIRTDNKSREMPCLYAVEPPRGTTLRVRGQYDALKREAQRKEIQKGEQLARGSRRNRTSLLATVAAMITIR